MGCGLCIKKKSLFVNFFLLFVSFLLPFLFSKGGALVRVFFFFFFTNFC